MAMSPHRDNSKVANDSARHDMSQTSSDPDLKYSGEKSIENTALSGPRPDDKQYPQGLKFVLLAGASIVAVFLIALDQVSKLRAGRTSV